MSFLQKAVFSTVPQSDQLPMFSIEFTDEPLEYPYEDEDANIPAAPGTLRLGEAIEGFAANLSVWSKRDYESHWRRELLALVRGQSKAALVVSYNDPQAASNMEIWRVYRDGECLHFQNQILWYSDLPPAFDILEMSRYMSDRQVVTAEGHRISEWDVSLREVELFLRRSDAL